MDTLFNFFFWTLAVFGTTNVITISAIMEPLRNWLNFSYIKYDDKKKIVAAVPRKNAFFGKMVGCTMCMGFWVGIVYSAILWSPANSVTSHAFLYNGFVRFMTDGFIGSITSWMLFLLIRNRQLGL